MLDAVEEEVARRRLPINLERGRALLDTNVIIDLMRTRNASRYQPAMEALMRSTTPQDPSAETLLKHWRRILCLKEW
jgi:hypothetical protein